MSTNNDITMNASQRKGKTAFVQASTQTVPVAKTTRRTGHVISTLAVLFLVFDGVIKVLKLAPVMESFALLGYPQALLLASASFCSPALLFM